MMTKLRPALVSRLLLAAPLALLLNGCFAYCPLYATSGCLEPSELDAQGARGEAAALVERLEDERSWVREEAARALGRHRLKAGEAGLLARLQDDRERRYVRAAAARALADLGSARAVPALGALAGRPDAPPELEIAVLEALCRLAPADPKTGVALQSLAEDEDLLVAAAAKHRRRTGCGG